MGYNSSMPPEEHNRIEDLKRSLYSRNAPDVRTRRKLRFSEQMSDVKQGWKDPEKPVPETPLNKAYEDHSMSFFTKLLIASILFCVAAIGGGVYIFLNGANFVSGNNIGITVTGPVSVSAGTPVAFDITVVNKNSVALQAADLAVAFPPGTTDPSDTTKSLQQMQELLGDLQPGASVTKTVNAVIFGEENLQKQVTATVTYGIKGSSAVFTKTQEYAVLINSSPATLTVSSFKEVTSGQDFDIKVDFRSNSASTLKGVVVNATYPFGYTFGSSSIAPQSGTTAWVLGDIPAGGDRVLVIHGRLTGEDSDLRAFHFSAGARSSATSASIGTPYAEAEQDVTIQKSFLSLGLSIGNDSSSADYVAQGGRSIDITVPWQNNVPETLTNAIITVHLSGTAYDNSQVRSNNGYFRSATNDIVWSQQTDQDLTSLAAGDSGTVTFSITPTSSLAGGASPTNPEVTVSVSATAERTQVSGASEQTTPVARNIKLSSNVSLSGRLVRTVGPFVNSGPIPPKVDQKTAYTVVWTVDNTSNAVAGAQVSATLPPYVSWLGQVSPATENISYDQPSGTVTWNVGNVSTYTNGSSARREVAFQIAFQPSLNQAGSAPTLVNQATLTATDNYTGVSLSDGQDPLTTSFSTDPGYQAGNEMVTK